MPYINKKDRNKFIGIDTFIPDTVGELNYLFSMLCLNYLKKKGEKYQTYNDIIGALECAKLEIYRKKISKYENKKIKNNGDIF